MPREQLALMLLLNATKIPFFNMKSNSQNPMSRGIQYNCPLNLHVQDHKDQILKRLLHLYSQCLPCFNYEDVPTYRKASSMPIELSVHVILQIRLMDRQTEHLKSSTKFLQLFFRLN